MTLMASRLRFNFIDGQSMWLTKVFVHVYVCSTQNYSCFAL
jgi:hypothetical protein